MYTMEVADSGMLTSNQDLIQAHFDTVGMVREKYLNKNLPIFTKNGHFCTS